MNRPEGLVERSDERGPRRRSRNGGERRELRFSLSHSSDFVYITIYDDNDDDDDDDDEIPQQRKEKVLKSKRRVASARGRSSIRIFKGSKKEGGGGGVYYRILKKMYEREKNNLSLFLAGPARPPPRFSPI